MDLFGLSDPHDGNKMYWIGHDGQHVRRCTGSEWVYIGLNVRPIIIVCMHVGLGMEEHPLAHSSHL